MHIHNFGSQGPARHLFKLSGAPAWVVWTSLTVVALVIFLPLLALTLLAILVGLIFFAVLYVLSTLINLGRNALNFLRRLVTGRDDQGRRNVTVMNRDSSDFQ
ncbi:MAG: hypothetical protein ACF8OB_14380 [Phycisphaeraceae bacterium JB051]